ncbi:MAG: ADP-ribosylation factor-like protein [Candidatus Alcyoniella australis]|nr:ADP-ribosylation factor-like protein [Candidatus Alcyoniella australis]
MAFVNKQTKEINCKIVFYGPQRSGKTRTLRFIHEQTKPENRGELISVSADDERTLFIDYVPLILGSYQGLRTRLHLYAMPGAPISQMNQRLILKGVDGIVFVADSSPDRVEDNVESLGGLRNLLAEIKKDPDKIPMVFQYNKQDLPGAISAEKLRSLLGARDVDFASNARSGQGLFPALKQISKLVLAQVDINGG